MFSRKMSENYGEIISFMQGIFLNDSDIVVV